MHCVSTNGQGKRRDVINHVSTKQTNNLINLKKHKTMKKMFLLSVALLCAGAGHSQERKKVYIMVSSDKAHEDEALNEMLADELVMAFANSRYYEPLDRKLTLGDGDEFKAMLNEERGYQRSGEVLSSEIIEMGAELGAEYLCVVKIVYSPTIRTNSVTARMISVKTRAAINSKSVRSPLNSEYEFTKVATAIAETLGDKPPKEKQADADAAAIRAAEEEAAAQQRKQDKEIWEKAGFGRRVANIRVQKQPSGAISLEAARHRCAEITISRFGKTARLPTIGELLQIYARRGDIWEKTYDSPWWSSKDYVKMVLWSETTCGKGYMSVNTDGEDNCRKPDKKALSICVIDIE